MPALDLVGLRLASGLTLDQIRARLPGDIADHIGPLMQSTAGERILSALEIPADVRTRIGDILLGEIVCTGERTLLSPKMAR
ncbi:hypothetical protein [Bradyrhizobium retamae]|nr:hypothetical protein [Bradyrhizobium retamae]